MPFAYEYYGGASYRTGYESFSRSKLYFGEPQERSSASASIRETGEVAARNISLSRFQLPVSTRFRNSAVTSRVTV
jgi:hypothetical protein